MSTEEDKISPSMAAHQKVKNKKKKKEVDDVRKIVHHEIRLKGHWSFDDLPFLPENFFICHESEQMSPMAPGERSCNSSGYPSLSKYTTIGLKLGEGQKKSRKEMKKILTEWQQVKCSNFSTIDHEPKMGTFPLYERALQKHIGHNGHEVIIQQTGCWRQKGHVSAKKTNGGRSSYELLNLAVEPTNDNHIRCCLCSFSAQITGDNNNTSQVTATNIFNQLTQPSSFYIKEEEEEEADDKKKTHD